VTIETEDTPDAPPTDAPPTDAARARALLANSSTAALATVAREPAGFPFATLIDVADDGTGRPLLLVSDLAEHTLNLDANAAASVLIAERAADGEPTLALGRVTIVGRVARVSDDELAAVRQRYLTRHPQAATYASFRDFSFRRLEPQAVRFIAGFGRMSWVTLEDYLATGALTAPRR